MNKLLFGRFAAGVLACTAVTACSAPPCEDLTVRKVPEGLEIRVGKGELKRIGGEFFGFNLESTEFQLSMWDQSARRVAPEVVSFLRRFDGAVYRFPGGTTANYYRWKDGTGDLADRPAVRIVDWIELPRIDFGLAEYFDFIAQVQGQAWYVLNLQGSFGEAADAQTLAKEAQALARYTRDKGVKMLRWELGNELDRAHDMWPHAKYVERARAMVEAVRAANPQAEFVGMMSDFDAQKETRNVTSSRYNQAVAAALVDLGVNEYEQHSYYDGPPEGPHLPNRLRQLCRSIEDAREAGGPSGKLGFWITEHARWPQAKPGQPWKASWHQTADLGAAIGIADMLIALTQIPEVRGSSIHALQATNGPWPLFHKRPGAAAKEQLSPSVALHAYAILRQAMLPVVLPSRSASSSRSGYSGGYDARGAVLASADRKRFSAWSVNRLEAKLPVTLEIPELAGRKAIAKLRAISAADTAAHNYDKPDSVLPTEHEISLSFDGRGRAVYEVPAFSVAALIMNFPAGGP